MVYIVESEFVARKKIDIEYFQNSEKIPMYTTGQNCASIYKNRIWKILVLENL